jgi:hypothetical protein
MRQPILRCQPGNLVTAKEAGAKNKRLGLKGVQKPRGYGHGATPPNRLAKDQPRGSKSRRKHQVAINRPGAPKHFPLRILPTLRKGSAI